MNSDKGFTLVELLVVIATASVLLGVGLLVFSSGAAQQAREQTDQANLRILNAVTMVYRVGQPEEDPFAVELDGDELRWESLVPAHLPHRLEPVVQGMAFVYSQAEQRWVYGPAESSTVTASKTASSYFTVGNPSTFRITGYDERGGPFVVVPSSIEGVVITEIGHGALSNKDLMAVILPGTIRSVAGLAFRGNNLTSIVLPQGLISIGNIAFADNQLTEITIPSSVTSVGDGAFNGNAITKIVIGDGVNIGDTWSFGIHRPGGGGNFNQVYDSPEGGAGTYLWNGTAWVKQ